MVSSFLIKGFHFSGVVRKNIGLKSLESLMDRISSLPDDSLLKILSLLTTEDVLKTSVLSKRWRNLWKLVPKLEYIHSDENVDHGRFLLFVDRSLLLNTAPVLESLRFMFISQGCNDVDIGFWVRIAVERGLRDFDYCGTALPFLMSLKDYHKACLLAEHSWYLNSPMYRLRMSNSRLVFRFSKHCTFIGWFT